MWLKEKPCLISVATAAVWCVWCGVILILTWCTVEVRMGPCVPGDLHCNSNDSHRYQVSLLKWFIFGRTSSRYDEHVKFGAERGKNRGESRATLASRWVFLALQTQFLSEFDDAEQEALPLLTPWTGIIGVCYSTQLKYVFRLDENVSRVRPSSQASLPSV